MSARFEPGQKVFVCSTTGGPVREEQVLRVGRKLVHVTDYGTPTAYRIDTGVINDNYGHWRLLTEQQFAERTEWVALSDRLRRVGLNLKPGAPRSVEWLRRVVEAAEAVTEVTS